MGKFFDRMKKELLAPDASLKDIQDALSVLGPVKINRLCKLIGVDPKGRKSQDVDEIIEEIVAGDSFDAPRVIRAYNVIAVLKNTRVDKADDFFDFAEKLKDEVGEYDDWLDYLVQLGKVLFGFK